MGRLRKAYEALTGRGGEKPAVRRAPPPLEKLNNFILLIFDSCRFDTFTEAGPKNAARLGALESRWSYASWTGPSHYNLLTGLMPHSSPRHVFASEYYKRDFLLFNDRLGASGIEFRSLVPRLYLPCFLRESLGYMTHAMVSLPVLNSHTPINTGFDTYRLMPRHNDMAAMLDMMEFHPERPSFYLLNVGETHYPYALPSEPEDAWPRISGVHGVFKHLDEHVVGGKLIEDDAGPRFFDQEKLDILRARQVETVRYLDGVLEKLFDIVPERTWITLTSDHGELFGEDGYFGHGPVQHDKVFEVPFVEGRIR
ncbi:hypothetical protein JW921_03785 [Candidatus Fermentibacterales bacterium]|nr:hypothetical protein [Candidatus Fermentibacterales bacterium]